MPIPAGLSGASVASAAGRSVASGTVSFDDVADHPDQRVPQGGQQVGGEILGVVGSRDRGGPLVGVLQAE